MKYLFALAFVSITACHDSADRTVTPVNNPGPTPIVEPPPAVDPIDVELTAVTLADECGAAAPAGAPAAGVSSARMRGDAQRRCEQTSMQLAITVAATGQPATISIKNVELFDESGKSLGTLASRLPTKWNDATGIYEAWDQKVVVGQTMASYVLASPDWSRIVNRFNATFTVKVAIAIAGVDRTLQKLVHVEQPTSLPPNVRT